VNHDPLDQAAAVAYDVYALLRELDPVRRDRADATLVRRQLTALALRAEDGGGQVKPSLLALANQLRAAPTAPLTDAAAWSAWREPMVDAYTALVLALRAVDIRVPAIRGTNYKRNLLHASTGVVGSLAVLFCPPWVPQAIAGSVFTMAWTFEASRRRSEAWNDRLMAFFGPVAHAHEAHRVNSASWYAIALVVLAWLNRPEISVLALLTLAFGDPAAAIVGRAFGRVRLLHGRSLEGLLAFVATAFLVGFPVLRYAAPDLGLADAALATIAAAVAGAIAELLSRRIDDNLTIPLAAAFAAWLVL
jgi:dolichol kinase